MGAAMRDQYDSNREKSRLRDDQDAADFRAIAGQPAGRRFLRSLLAETGVQRGSYSGDALSMAYREGQRSIGMAIYRRFADCQDLYINLLQESDGE